MAEMKSETRELGEFNAISMRGLGKLRIEQGKTQSVTINGDEVAISRITTNVSNNKLVIDVGRDWVEKISAGFDLFSRNDIHIHIVVKDLKELEVAGAAEIEVADLKTDDLTLKLIGASSVKVENLKADSLHTELPGAGKIRVSGSVKEQTLKMTGAGNFSGHDLESKNADVTLSGVGSAQLWVKDELAVTITGVGSVEYYGTPKVKQSMTMLGKVTSLGDK
jgi:hypothetical protein